jgi:hypothetical protein
MKLLRHNHFGFQPPRSPISPTPPEVKIPTFDQRVRGMVNSSMINEYGSMFFESGEASSSSAAPPPPPSTYEVPQPFGSPVAPALALDTTYDPKAPPDWDDHFSIEIFGWSSYPAPYDGMNDDRHVLFPKITISEFSSVLSPMHCLVSLSSHRREPTPWRWSGVGIRGRDSD